MADLRARYYGCESSFIARAEEGALGFLRWLETVSSIFQDLEFDGSL